MNSTFHAMFPIPGPGSKQSTAATPPTALKVMKVKGKKDLWNWDFLMNVRGQIDRHKLSYIIIIHQISSERCT